MEAREGFSPNVPKHSQAVRGNNTFATSESYQFNLISSTISMKFFRGTMVHLTALARNVRMSLASIYGKTASLAEPARPGYTLFVVGQAELAVFRIGFLRFGTGDL